MEKFLALTTLNALDPLPALGRKVETKPNPAPCAKAAAIEHFERKPHELSSGRSGQAGRSDADRWFYECVADAFKSAQPGIARANARAAELFRPFVPHGDQRPAGEGQSWHSDEGRHEANHRADSGDAGGGFGVTDFRAIEERIVASQQAQGGEAGRAGSAGPAVTGTGYYAASVLERLPADVRAQYEKLQLMPAGLERTHLKSKLYMHLRRSGLLGG